MSKFTKSCAAFLLCFVLLFNLCGTALAAVKITTQPKNVTVGYGETAKVSVKASGDGLTYLWYYANKGSDTFKKSSVTSRAYSVTMNEDRDGRRVYCLVKDSSGSKKKSEIVTLSLDRKTLAINTQPQSVSVAPGATAKISVSATGDGLSYTWYSKDAGASDFVKSSITKSTYSVTMNDSRDGRQLYCVVADAYGNKIQSNTVTMKQVKTLAQITSQPKDVSVAPGEAAAVTVGAVGDGITYTWYTKDVGGTAFAKSSITKATYSVTMNDARDGRQLYCVVKDNYGNEVKSNTVTMTMKKTLAQITAQPEDVSVAPGATAKISVEAIGDGITYTWYTKDAGASKFSKSSITKSYYSVTMNDTRDGRQVYCVVKDAYGNEATSEIATMYQVKVEASITKQPESVTVAEGEKATITVEAIGDGITYTWYTKDKGASSFSKSSITTSSYAVTMNATRHGRQIYCVVKDAYGNSVKSDVVTMSMIIPEIVITKQPESVLVAPGEKATVTVEATGAGLTYAWYSKDNGADEFVKSSITSSTYSVTMNAARHGRELYCVITDKYGETKQTETVKLEMVITPLEIVGVSATEVTVAEMEKAEVTVEAKGDGLTYTWYVLDRNATEYVKSSITESTYSLTMTVARHARQVYCVVKDAYGNELTTPVITLNMIITPLAITAQPADVKVAEGEAAEVTVEATGDGLTYAWYFAEKDSDEFKLTTSFTTDTYSVAMNEARDGRQVYCVITDRYGYNVTSDVATLSMKGNLEITKNIPASCYFFNHFPYTFTAEAEGDEVTYAWYSAAPESEDFVLVSEENTYSITMSPELDGTRFYFVATDMYGETVESRTCVLNLRLALEITTQPVSVSVLDGEEAVITFEAVGNELTYEWYFAAPGSTEFKKTDSFTSNEYRVTMNEDRDGRQVYCVVTDMWNQQVQTDTVTMTIKPPVEYEAAEDGTIAITGYIGTDADLVIPSVIDGATVTAVAENAFKDNTVLTTITLPTTVTSIGASAFENCTSLEVVTLSDNVENIGVAAFKNCTSLASMIIDND